MTFFSPKTSKDTVGPIVTIHSPFKTGTTTIGAALVILGIGAEDHGFHRELNRGYKNEIDKANSLALNATSFSVFRKKHQRSIELLVGALFEFAKGYQIFGDVPFGHLRIHPFVKKLMLPTAKFIWINRNEKAWLASARNWHLSHPEIYPNAEKNWKLNPEIEIYKLIRMRDEGFTEFGKLIKEFPQDCLVLSLEKDARWEPLCRFFGLPVPETTFPNLNKR